MLASILTHALLFKVLRQSRLARQFGTRAPQKRARLPALHRQSHRLLRNGWFVEDVGGGYVDHLPVAGADGAGGPGLHRNATDEGAAIAEFD